MAVELRLPNINGMTEKEQIVQIRSYLYQFIPQLQWALNNLSTPTTTTTVTTVAPASNTSVVNPSNEANISEIKALLIKTADTVNAYYEELSEKYESVYEAQSDFGRYTEEKFQEIVTDSNGIKQSFSDIQTIVSKVPEIDDWVSEAKAQIFAGEVDYTDGVPVYGVEIRQKNTVNGEETFNKFARFTAGKLSFYDRNDTEVAYISDYKLYITHAEVLGNLKVGGYVWDTSNGLVLRWEG